MPRINTNVSALQTQNILNDINSRFGQSVQRLSSGFRINSASDDAAGLGIANRLKADVKALKQSSRNAEQADSLLQVAEGGAQEIENILERMKELATQSASDNVNDSDRALIDDEFQDLQSEIDRITDTTKFQGNKLLNGSFGAQLEQSGDGTDAGTFGGNLSTGGTNDAAPTDGDASDGFGISINFEETGHFQILDDASDSEADDTASNAVFQVQAVTNSGSTAGVTETFAASDLADGSIDDGDTMQLDAFGFEIQVDDASDFLAEIDDSAGSNTANVDINTGSSTFLVSGNAGTAAAGKISVSGGGLDLTTDALGSDSTQGAVSAQSLDTRTNAENALVSLDQAIDDVSTALGDVGSSLNRIGFAKSNTETAIENFSAAESVIRDVDIASETTRFSRLQIQQQAATSMLAQANSAPQQVLGLIQG